MADIAKAYEFLNKMHRLEMSTTALRGQELDYKREFMKEKGYSADQIEKADDYEFFAYLVPRQKGASQRASAKKAATKKVAAKKAKSRK